MKKKLMMVAVLLGALSLGACVDDNESASVTNIRDAKAEQLRSIAAMNNAEAEAKLIYANADAALKQAEAALKQAQADKAAAEALVEQLKAQMEQDTYDAELAAQLAEAEQRRLAAEQTIAYIGGEMQKYQLELDKKLADLQALLLQAQLDLQGKQDYVADEAMARLEKLAKNYSTLLYSVTEENNNLLAARSEKASLEAELLTWKESQAKTAEEAQIAIQLIDNQIAYYKQYTNYTEDLQGLQNQWTLKQEEINLASDNANVAEKAWSTAEDEVGNNTKLSALLESINENELVMMYKNSSDYAVSFPYTDEFGNSSDWTVWFGSYNPISNFGFQNTGEIESEDGKYVYSFNELNLEVAPKNLDQLRINVKRALDALNIDGLDNAINAAKTGTKARLDAAIANTNEAKKAWDADPTDKDLENAYYDQLQLQVNAQTQYDNSVEALNNAKEVEKKLNDNLALVASSTADLEKAVADYNAARKTVYEPVSKLYFAYQDAEEALLDLKAESNAMEAVLKGDSGYETTYETQNLWDYVISNISGEWLGAYPNGGSVNVGISRPDYDSEGNFIGTYTDYQDIYFNIWNAVLVYTSTVETTEIAGAEAIQKIIDGLEATKAEYEATIEAYNNIDATDDAMAKQKAIELKDAEIAGREEILNVLNIQLQQAKARLDAAVAAYDTEEQPETQA